MSNAKILVISSSYYPDLSAKHLQTCVDILEKSDYKHEVEVVTAGTYEIPAVIRHFHVHRPFDAYIPLGLLLKGSTDHYEFIWEHVKSCFIQFAMDGVLIGNGIISAPDMALLRARVEDGERVQEAFNAVDYLIRMRKKS